MATTQTVKRRTAATKRSTAAKKAAATRARKTTARSTTRAKANAKRRVNQPTTTKQARPLIAQAEFVGAVANNVVQTAVKTGTQVVAGATKRVAKFL
jgi:hypothetical protein